MNQQWKGHFVIYSIGERNFLLSLVKGFILLQVMKIFELKKWYLFLMDLICNMGKHKQDILMASSWIVLIGFSALMHRIYSIWHTLYIGSEKQWKTMTTWVISDLTVLQVFDRIAMEWLMWMEKIIFLIYVMLSYSQKHKFSLLDGWYHLIFV